MATVKINKMSSQLPRFKIQLRREHKTAVEELARELEKETENILSKTFKRRSSPDLYPDGSRKSNPGFADAKLKVKKSIKSHNRKGYDLKIRIFISDKTGKEHVSWHIMTNGRKAIVPVKASILRWFERTPQNVTKIGSTLVEDFNEYGQIIFRPYAKAVRGRKWYQRTGKEMKKFIRQHTKLGWTIIVNTNDNYKP